jgi:predicted dehydrogenase
MTRRNLIRTGSAAFALMPRHVLGGTRFKSPNEKLNIAAVGFGGMGANYIAGCASENIVALCDVDDKLAAPVFEKYPVAKRYKDFRRLFDRAKDFDAVIIGTPDHCHAAIAVGAMQLGKHVYCAKPLTRTIYECRRVTQFARETGVATQMSVQSCAGDPALTTVEWVQSGAAGTVREVHVWTDRPVWPQALARPTAEPPVPGSLDWDLWIGPSRFVPYNPIYHPFNWRGWVDFGTGALGDMACHAFHIAFTALKLEAPVAVQASTSFRMIPDPDATTWYKARKVESVQTFPAASVVTWDFPARGSQPAVRMFWYDGGMRPPRPAGLEPGYNMESSGLMFAGDKGVLLGGFSGGDLHLVRPDADSWKPPEKTLPRTKGHYLEWIEAAKGGKPANCRFEFAGLLAETALLGVVAQRTGADLAWDSAGGRFTNNAEANALLQVDYRKGWTL